MVKIVTSATKAPRLERGDRVQFAENSRWWEVRANDGRWAILTRQAAFEPKGTLRYTIVDQDHGHRGPANTLGQGWDVEEEGGCEELLAALQAHEFGITTRNRVEARIVAVERTNKED